MKHIVYLTTNLINGKQYVGDHSSENINDNYLGSGLLIKKAIKKYGKENFKRENLEICESKKEAFEKQEKYINKFKTNKPRGYNISPKGGHDVKNSMSKESVEKMRNSLKGRASHRKGLSLEEEYGDRAEDIRKKLKNPKSEDHKKKMSKALKGRVPWNKGKTDIYSEDAKRKMSEKASLRTGEKNPFYGKKHTKEAIEKMKNNFPNRSGENNPNSKAYKNKTK